MQTISPSPPSQYTNRFRFLKSSLSVCVGESLAVCKLSWETTAYCYGKCSLWTVPTWNLQLKEVSCAPGLQVHPAPPCADSKMEWGPWNLRGRGDGYKAAVRNSTIKVHQCFLFHIPEREMSDGSRAGVYTREIYTWRKQNEVIVWKNSWNVDFWHHIVPC